MDMDMGPAVALSLSAAIQSALGASTVLTDVTLTGLNFGPYYSSGGCASTGSDYVVPVSVTYGGDTALQLAQKYKFSPVVEYLTGK